jgi:hypothetical protein
MTGPEGTKRNNDQEWAMDLEVAKGILMGLVALVGVGGIIDMFRP